MSRTRYAKLPGEPGEMDQRPIVDSSQRIRKSKRVKTIRPSRSGRAVVIETTLPAEIAHYFSSDDYAELVGAGLAPFDLGETYCARLPSVYESITNTGTGMGIFIACASENIVFCAAFFFVLAVGAAYNFGKKYYEKMDAHQEKNNTYANVQKALGLKKENKPITSEEYNSHLRNSLAKLEKALNDEISEDIYARRKYEKIDFYGPHDTNEKIKPSDISIRHTFRTHSENPDDVDEEVQNPGKWNKFVNKVVKPIYTSLSLSAFTYWILWISAAVVLGAYADVGIFVLGLAAVFIPPALPYIGIKVRNWFRNKGYEDDEKARLTKIAESDTPDLLNRAMKRATYNNEVENLDEQFNTLIAKEKKLNQQLNIIVTTSTPDIRKEEINLYRDESFGAEPFNQTAATWYTSVVSEYGMSQYNAWVLSDFFKSIPSFALSIPFFGPIMGGILLAIGLGVAALDARKKYKAASLDERLRPNAPVDDEGNPITLEKVIAIRQHELKELNTERDENLAQLNTLSNQTGEPAYQVPAILNRAIPTPPAPMHWGRKIFNCLDWTATGFFFARLFVTGGTATYLPVALGAGALFSNPITLGIIALSGLVYLGVKVYQAYQKAKQNDAKEMVAKIKDMDQQIHVAKLTNRNIDKQKQVLEKTIRLNNRQKHAQNEQQKVAMHPAPTPATATATATATNLHNLSMFSTHDPKATTNSILPQENGRVIQVR